jgi:hypothetical protein
MISKSNVKRGTNFEKHVELTPENCPALEGKSAGDKVVVSPKTFQNLMAAKSIATFIKEKLPKGAPNQKLNVWDTEGKNWAIYENIKKQPFDVIRERCGEKGYLDQIEKLDKEERPSTTIEAVLTKPTIKNAVAKGLQAVYCETGKCGEHAQLSFDLTMDKEFCKKLGTPLAEGSTVLLVVSPEDHNYVLICAPDSIDITPDGNYVFSHPERIVVLDPWVPYPTPHTLDRSDPSVINSNPWVLNSFSFHENGPDDKPFQGVPFHKMMVKVKTLPKDDIKKMLKQKNLPNDETLRDYAALERMEKTFQTASSRISGLAGMEKDGHKISAKEAAKTIVESGNLHSMLYDDPFSSKTPTDIYINRDTNEEISFAIADKKMVKNLLKAHKESTDAHFGATPEYVEKAFEKKPEKLATANLYKDHLVNGAGIDINEVYHFNPTTTNTTQTQEDDSKDS